MLFQKALYSIQNLHSLKLLLEYETDIQSDEHRYHHHILASYMISVHFIRCRVDKHTDTPFHPIQVSNDLVYIGNIINLALVFGI